MRPGLSAEEFLATIWQERRRYVREGRIKQPHPWRVALSQGKVSREALIESIAKALVEGAAFIHRPANKEIVMKSLARNLRLSKPEQMENATRD